MELVKIAVIVNTKGLKGVLKIKSFTDFKEERYKTGNTLYISFKGEYKVVTVNSFQISKPTDNIGFKEFDDINQVEKYKGSEIFISKDQIHKLEIDEFYFDELIGMEVYSKEELLGKCIDIREYPQGEILVIKTNKKDLLIPFRKEFIEEVNVEENKIMIIFWEGLL